MALLTYKSIVDYDSQQGAFEDFLTNFKSSAAVSESAATTALQDLHLEDDDLSDDYDFMDDIDGGGRARGRRARADPDPKKKYMEMLQQVADRAGSEVLIELDDMDVYERALVESTHEDLRLVESIERNTKHYTEIFSRAVDKVMPRPTRDVSFKDDVLDIIMAQRRTRNDAMHHAMEQADELDASTASIFPAELTRRYTLVFQPRSFGPDAAAAGTKALAVRQVRGEHLGRLIMVRGITTRTSDVKPAVRINAYSCDRCGCEVFQPVAGRQFTPLVECPSDACRKNQSRGQLFPSTRASRFEPFQEIKMQEMADQVPVGHIPRTLTVHCHGTLTRQIKPGDLVDVAGIFLPTPYTGFKAIRAGLLTDTYLEAQHVRQHKKAYERLTMDRALFARIERQRDGGQMYELLARSIAPEIYGHADVKKALLLLLIGGVGKAMGDGMRIRGDINVCLMGDPGVAKSQLLKYITAVAPRGVYTTGRGSSGVGLTAAVMRDPVTEEMVLEGGALVLADHGVCCIDEFDKMDDGDRTAIHEVMEQQTISISKAGITTTLNARTSILAAANPVYGRYNPRVSPIENINLPAALLSRFDILFLMLDTPSPEADEELARHVTYVHMHNRHPDPDPAAGPVGPDAVVFTPAEMRQYIARARTWRPVVGRDVADYMVTAYVRMRQQQKRDEHSKRQFSHVSPRTLLGVLRLSQALARLRFSGQVVLADVDEALRLLDVSKATLSADLHPGRPNPDQSPSSKIFHLIRAMAASGVAAPARPDDDDDDEDLDPDDAGPGPRAAELSMKTVRDRVLAKGFTDDQLREAIDEYAALDVWQTAAEGTRLVFIEAGDMDLDMDL
ncbi:MAG: Mcm2-7 hexameric complex component [Phylliscum demangeonii]|nr:MAG: Mcm2-7 hexameric complex component [Phylliscum demangeonii]